MTAPEFIAVWKLTFGHNWVDWLAAASFKEKLIGNHSHQLMDLVALGVMEYKDGNMDDLAMIRLKQ